MYIYGFLKQKTNGSVLFGWQTADTVVAGTSAREVVVFNKEGKESAKMKADAAVFSCASSPDGKYIFAGDNSSSVYCFLTCVN